MALRQLTTPEMISLTVAWTSQASPERGILLAIPQVAGLVPQIDAAHGALVHTQPTAAADAHLEAIQEKERIVDLRHDTVLRGCHALLSGLAELIADPAERAVFVALRHTLLPNGLEATQQSYRAESGSAAQLAARLTPADIALLSSIAVGSATMWHYVQEWIEHGATLGELEDQRGSLESNTAKPIDVVAARNRWIRAVSAVRTVLELVGVDDATARPLVQRVEEAERKAAKRAAEQARKAIKTAPPPAPVDPATPVAPKPVPG